MFGVFGKVMIVSWVMFVFQVVYDNGVKEKVGFDSFVFLVRNVCGGILKKFMVLNDVMLNVEVYLEIYEVCVDGELLICELVDVLFMVQCYFLFQFFEKVFGRG